MLNLTTVTDQHSSQGTELSRHTYQTTRTNRHELKDCWCELNDSSRSTFLPRYQTQLTHLPNLTHRPMLNLATVTDQHSSQGTELSRHTWCRTKQILPTNIPPKVPNSTNGWMDGWISGGQMNGWMLRWMDAEMDGLINLLTFYYGWMMDGSVDLLNFWVTAWCLFQGMNGSLIGQLIDWSNLR